MKIKKMALSLAAAGLLSGCGVMKQKAAEFYLGRARKVAEAANPAPAEVEAAFANLERVLTYEPDSVQAVELLETLADAASKNGFAKAQELEAAALKHALAANPLNWAARESLINFYATRGDTAGLEAMAAGAQALAASGDAKVRYCALLAALAARASAVPWLESEGYLSLNKTPAAFFEKLSAYAAAAETIPAIRTELERIAAADPGVKNYAPAGLVSAAEVDGADLLRDPGAIKRVFDFNARAGSDQAFRKAAEMAVQGNAALVGKDYSQARAFYQGALNQYPDFIDARRGLGEADFQEGAALAAAGEKQQEASQLLYKAYAEIGAVISAASKNGGVLPFIKPEKFLGEVYSLKAADLAALRVVEGQRLKTPAKLEAEFKAALDEALKLSPEGRLARELNERYSKEGF